MIKKLFLGLFALVLLFGIGSLFISNTYHIETTVYIHASPKVVFEQINTLSNWEKWNQWLRMDTTMKVTYNDIKSGVGAKYQWTSANQNVGNGSLTITKSVPAKMVETELNFDGRGNGINGFKLEPSGDSTKLTSYFTSDMGWNPVYKYLSVLSKKAMVEMADKGLLSIKQYIEQMMLSATPENSIDLVEIKEAVPYLSINAKVPKEMIGKELERCYGMLQEEIKKQNLQVSKSIAPFAIYYKAENNMFEFDACIATDRPGKNSKEISASELKSGRYIMSRYFGRYEDTQATHQAIQAYAQTNHLTIIGAPAEVYVTDPTVEKDPSKWETDIYYPIN